MLYTPPLQHEVLRVLTGERVAFRSTVRKHPCFRQLTLKRGHQNYFTLIHVLILLQLNTANSGGDKCGPEAVTRAVEELIPAEQRAALRFSGAAYKTQMTPTDQQLAIQSAMSNSEGARRLSPDCSSNADCVSCTATGATCGWCPSTCA